MLRIKNLLTVSCLIIPFSLSAQLSPPVAERIPYEIHTPNGDRTDYYYWMKFRDDKKVKQYLEAENAYMEKQMAHTKPLQKKLADEMKSRVKDDENTVPYKKGGYYYYTRYVEGGEYGIFCRRKDNMDAAEEIVLDGNALAKGNSFFNWEIEMSPDQNMVAVIMDTHGRNFFDIKIKDLRTGEWLKDKITDTRNGCEWSSDNRSIVYGVPDKETLRVYQVKKHTLGENEKSDKLLYQENDETLDLDVEKSRSEKYILIDAERTDASIWRYTDASNPDKLTVIQPLEAGLYYTADHAEGDHFMIRTNYKAVNYRLCAAPMASTTKEHWKDIIPERKDVYLSDVEYFSDYLVAEEMQNGLPVLRIIPRGGNESFIPFEETAYYAALSYNPDYNSNTVRYIYSSFVTPATVYDYNMATKERKLMKQDEVPNYTKANYVTERMMVPARDGKMIPLTILYNKNTYKKDGQHPGYIYSYGSYGSNSDDYFDETLISLLDRGFIYAQPHIRGGSEMGGAWYDDGKMLNKKNTFFDFIDASEWLEKNNYVAPDKLFAYGLSAGGLLMGAINNYRPDLYKGIIAGVPFVDVMTTMEDETIPLTTFEWMEWGNPAIKEQYDYMITYSPYDNVEKKNYPNLLVLTGWEDSQVQYFEPAKWVAKLRYMKTDNNRLYFHTNFNAGHGGSYGRYEYLDEVALMWAFMLDCLGVKK